MNIIYSNVDSLPHPSTGYYQDMRIQGAVVMATGGYLLALGLKDNSIATLPLVLAGMWGVTLGYDVYKAGNNLEKFFYSKESYASVDTQEMLNAALKGTFRKSLFPSCTGVKLYKLNKFRTLAEKP
ncbi:MAG: hypothetical protein V4489_05605 [Chlamydiota bacterium]